MAALLAAAADPAALGPDLYPSYAHWKSQRGIRALEVRRRRARGRQEGDREWVEAEEDPGWLFINQLHAPPAPGCRLVGWLKCM